MAAKVVLQRLGELETRDGESFAAGETRDELGVDATGEGEPTGGRRWGARSLVRSSTTQLPSVVGAESQSSNG